MTVDQAKRLVGHWPEEAQYLLAERWGMMEDFWKAVADTRRTWGQTWGDDVAQSQLRIEREKEWKISTQSSALEQPRLF